MHLANHAPVQVVDHLAGISLKPCHYEEIIGTAPGIGWFEVHPENYMTAGGPAHHYLGRIREQHDISLHGVGLSIGGAGPLDRDHLARLKALCDRYQPVRFSEHLAWSSHGGVFHNDLLPLPYTDETLDRVCEHVDQLQNALGRTILIENPSVYVTFRDDQMPEPVFLAEIARRTGCGLLLDVNNLHVSCTNRREDPEAWLRDFPLDRVGQVHLAGHDLQMEDDGGLLLIDSHDRAVSNIVWLLFEAVIDATGPLPVLIERDADIPPLDQLVAEARKAASLMDQTGNAFSRPGAIHAVG